MNAPENISSLRQEIAQHLANSGEATAKQIAEAILQEKVEVARALNDMHKSAEVEREKKRGNEYVYWLSAAAAAPKKAEAPKVVAVPSPHAADNEFSLLGVIADIREAIGDKEGRIMLGDLAGTIKQALDGLNTSLNVWEATMLDSIGAGTAHSVASAIKALKVERDNLRTALDNSRKAENHAINEADRLRNELAAERLAREVLQEQSDAVDVKDAAVGYLIRAPKRKPRLVTKPESAREAALAAVRAGAGRAEVLALVPEGTARRGAEWKPS